MHHLRRNGSGLLALLLSLLLPAAALADQQYFDVELILFRHAEATSQQAGERWPRTPDAPHHARYADLVSDGEPTADSYVRLGENALQLRGVAQRLERHGGYTVLLHTGWRQPGLGNAEAAAVRLPPGGAASGGGDEMPDTGSLAPRRPPPGLSGHVRIYRERFLHAEFDLRYLRGEQADGQAGRASLPLFEQLAPVVVMQDRRRMRSGELHHLDHPVIGALVRVTPVE
ncbi:MAG: peptidoglycan binding protein CsiV [Ectothiorhodospiraceae bacterium]|nr:peptidoglycan binding protein CsiV [Ectothiorhodospiraceae bacterium]